MALTSQPIEVAAITLRDPLRSIDHLRQLVNVPRRAHGAGLEISRPPLNHRIRNLRDHLLDEAAQMRTSAEIRRRNVPNPIRVRAELIALLE